jgi:hypothetical protein
MGDGRLQSTQLIMGKEEKSQRALADQRISFINALN